MYPAGADEKLLQQNEENNRYSITLIFKDLAQYKGTNMNGFIANNWYD